MATSVDRAAVTDNFLAHYGVKGMRWGFRRKSDGTVVSSGKRTKASEDHEKTRELIKEKTKTLSNSELKIINERLQLEKTYSELTTSKSGLARLNKGTKATRDVLAVADIAQKVHSIATSPAARAVRTAMTK